MKKGIAILLICVLTVSLLPLAGSAEAAGTPAQEQLLSDFYQKNPNMQHPRIMADGSRFAQIKAQVASDPLMMAWYADLKQSGDAMLDAPVSQYPVLTGGADMVWLARTIKSRIETLGFLYRISGETQYAERAWKEMEAVAAFPDWNHKHFLDASEITAGFGIGYDWLYDYLSDAQKEVVKQAIITFGLEKALEYYNNPDMDGQWVDKASNWNVVCTGSMGIGALAILDEEPELCSDIIIRGFDSVKPALAMFAPDGNWEEGYTYWQYTMKYFVEYMAALHTAVGTTYGFEDVEGIRNAGYVPMYSFGAKQHFNYHDSNDPPSAPGMFWLSDKYEVKEMTAFRVSQMEILDIDPVVYDLLWYNPALNDMSAKAPLDGYFRGVETASFRDVWYSGEANYLGFHAGGNNVGHSHLDAGTFVLDSQGERFIRDLGADDYLLENYLNNPHGLQYYRRRAEGHNVLVVNPDANPDQMLNATPVITNFESAPEGGFAIADVTSAYPLVTKSARRGVWLTDNRQRMVVQDEAVFQDGAEVWWFAHTDAAVTVSADGKSATMEKNGKRLWVGITSDTDCKFTVMDAKPLPTSPNPEQNQNGGIRKLAIHMENVTQVRLTVEFAPLAAGETQPGSTMPVKALSDWKLDAANMPKLTELSVNHTPVPLVEGQCNYTAALFPAENDAPIIDAKGEGDITVAVPERHASVKTAKLMLRKQVSGQTYVKTYTVSPPVQYTMLVDNDFDRGVQPNNGTNFGGGLLSQYLLYPEGGSIYEQPAEGADSAGDSLVLESSRSDTGQYPKIHHDFVNMNGRVYGQAPSAAVTPRLIFEVNIKTEETNIQRGLFSVKDNLGNSFMLAMIDTDGVFKRGNSNFSVIPGSEMLACQPGKWYHIMAVLDLEHKTYDFYIDGVRQFAGQAITGMAGDQIQYFRLEHVDRFRTSGQTHSTGGKTYIDDLKVYALEQQPVDLQAYASLDTEKQQVVLTWNAPLQKETVTADNLTLTSGGRQVPFRVAAAGARHTVLALEGSADTGPELSVTQGVKDAWGGTLANAQVPIAKVDSSVCGAISRYAVDGTTVTGTGQLQAGDILTVESMVSNPSGSGQEIWLIVGTYKNGRLLDVMIEKYPCTGSELQKSFTEELSLPPGFSPVCSIKGFLWLGGSMCPIAVKHVLPASQSDVQ